MSKLPTLGRRTLDRTLVAKDTLLLTFTKRAIDKTVDAGTATRRRPAVAVGVGLAASLFLRADKERFLRTAAANAIGLEDVQGTEPFGVADGVLVVGTRLRGTLSTFAVTRRA